MDIRDLVKKWEDVLKEGNEIISDRIMKTTAIMLENQHNFLTETSAYFGGGASPGALTSNTNPYYRKVKITNLT